MINILQKILHILFPPDFNLLDIEKIPHAPQANQTWIYARFDYHSVSGKKLIYLIKKYEYPYVAKEIAKALYEHIQDYISEQNQFHYFLDPYITIVPASLIRRKNYGFNQNHLIAKYFANHVSGNYIKDMFIKTKNSSKQALVQTKSQRIKNIRNSFVFNKKIKDKIYQKDIIIIDDLVTTGATLCELKRLLLKNGARNVVGITVAH